jgi:hypothetical protein
LLCIHGDWHPYVMKTFVLFFHRKSSLYQQNNVNEEDKIIIKKYVLYNTKTVIWGFQCMFVEEAGLVVCCAMWLGNFFPKLWGNVQPSSSGLWVRPQTCNPEDEGSMFLRNVMEEIPNHRAQQSRRSASSIRLEVCNQS